MISICTTEGVIPAVRVYVADRTFWTPGYVA
jgi:hypothetical protein